MAEYSYAEKRSIMDNILGQCFASDKSSLEGLSVGDISKYVFEQYANADMGKLKFFLYSEGSKGNNKPYTYHKRLSVAKFCLIQDIIRDIIKHELNDEAGLDDLIIEDF